MRRTLAARTKFEPVGMPSSGRVDIMFSTYGGEPDSYGDIVDQGAFTKAIQAAQADPKRMPYLIYGHDWDSLPLGTITSLHDTATGPVASCQFDMDDPTAARVYSKIRKGLIRESSFGFDVEAEGIGWDGHNHIKSVWPLYEISPVLVGANRSTQMMNVRSASRADGSVRRPTYRQAGVELVMERLRRRGFKEVQ